MLGPTSNEIMLLSEMNLAMLDYRKKICSKCSTEQKKKRHCYISIIDGKTTSCMTMQKSIEQRKKVKEIKSKCIGEMMGGLLALRDEIKKEQKIEYVNNDLIN